MSGSTLKIVAASIIGIALIAGLFFLLERPPEAAGLDVESVLKDGIKAFQEFSVNGRQRITVHREGKPVLRETIRTPIEPLLIAQAMESQDEKARAKLMIYRRLMELSSGFKIDGGFLRSHDAKITGAEKVAGRWAWEMEIRPNSVDGGHLKIYFDKDTSYPLKRIKYNRQGLRENVVEYVEVKGYDKKEHEFFPQKLRHDRIGMPPGEKRPPFNPPAGRPPIDGRPEFPRPPGPIGPFEGPGMRRPRPQALIPADAFLNEYVSQGRVLFPTYIPEGYHFIGGIKPPFTPGDKMGKVHMIFSDGINNLSVFQIHLPVAHFRGGDAKAYLRAKAQEFLNSFPEGAALRRVKEGLIVGIADLDPETIEKVIESMVFFEGDQPVHLTEEIPLNPEGLF